jgi:NADPH:quinone reductase-like Zn-dependent oxidoreductase
MKQVWIPKIGGPNVLEVREAPDPVAKEGEVRVRVHAAGINFADIMARMGLYPDAPKIPCVVGYEVAGVVEELGAGTQGLEVGDRVMAMIRFGGYSDVVVAPASQVVKFSEKLSFEEAAAIPVQYLTAWTMLIRLGNLQKGERALIHSAGGGVGLAAIQMAQWRGAEVIGTASAGKHDRLKKLGVEHCIDYRTQDFEQEVRRITKGEGVHLAIDAVGGESFKKSYRSLATMGRLFCFGASSFAPGKSRSVLSALGGLMKMPSFKPIPLMQENRGVFGVNMGHMWHIGPTLVDMLKEINAKVEEGTFSPTVDCSFSFDEAAEAHRYIQDRKNFGKVLLVP